jgi:hypothetical protein
MTVLFANYNCERASFEKLLGPEYEKRILIFQGASGHGKTMLLQYCQAHAEEAGVLCIPIQFRSSMVSMAEIFYRSCSYVGWDRVPNFYEQLVDLQDVSRVQIGHNRLSGSHNSINVALSGENPEARENRRLALTEAWLNDIRAACRPLLFIMDSYEQATTEVKEWISGPFLTRIVRVDPVRVLIAGQEVPDANTIEWGKYCVTYSLYGVPEAKHWLPLVEAMDRHIPFDDPETWLAGVCHALGGQPSTIMKIIQSLPKGRRSKESNHDK